MSEISVLRIENPSCFWGIIKNGIGAVQYNEDEYERLNQELNRLYGATYRNVDELKPAVLEKGQVCAVYSEEQKCWCRAIIESFLTSADDYQSDCFLVDHAQYVAVKTKRIRAAVESCWQLPYRAKEFKLHRIGPVKLHIDFSNDKTEIRPASQWDESAIAYFQNLIKESNYTEVKLCSMEENRYSVFLYVKTKDSVVCVNDDLVAKNFACFADSIISKDFYKTPCKCTNKAPVQVDSSYLLTSQLVTSQNKNEDGVGVNPAINLWPVLLQKKSLEKYYVGSILKDALENQPESTFFAVDRWTEKDGHKDIKRDCAKLLQMLNPDSLKSDDEHNLDQLSKPVSKAQPPIVLRKRIKPCSTLELAPLSTELKKELIRNNFLGPNFTESYCWPSIAHGCDTVIISSHGRNPMNYIPPLLTYLQFSSAASKMLPVRNGPLAFFICPGWKKAQLVFELVETYGKFVGPLNPMLVLLGLNKDEAKNLKLRRGCEVIVTTPESLLRLFEVHNLLFLRVCHLVLDEVDNLFSEANDQMLRILDFYKKVVNAEEHENAPQQIIAVGTRWMKELDNIAGEYMTDPHVVITSMEEAAFYGNVQQVVELCLDCQKISALLRALDFTPTIAQKVLIFVNSTDEAEIAFKAVESSSIFCMKIHEHISFHLNQIVKHWNKPYSSGTHVVLVLTDGCLPPLRISDATCVIHFGFPKSQRIFGSRILSMLDNFQNRIDKDASLELECPKAKSILLMSEKNAHHAVGILRYLEHTDARIPTELYDFTAGILSTKEAMKYGKPLCQFLKSYGVCKESNTCPFRHQFNPEIDLPRRIGESTLPVEGNISMVPLVIVDATCYYGRIVSNGDAYDCLVKEMTAFFSSSNKVSVDKLEKLALCGLQDGTHYHRVEVLEIYQKNDNCLGCTVKVNLIDEGRQEEVLEHNLLHLPPTFHSLPPQLVEFIVCRVKPIDKEYEWNPKVTRHINRRIKGKLHEAKVVFTLGNTVFIDPMVRVVNLVDLKTSINEYNVRSEILSTGMGDDNPAHLEALNAFCRGTHNIVPNKETTGQNEKNVCKSSKFQNNSKEVQENIAVTEMNNESQQLEKEKRDVDDVSPETEVIEETPRLAGGSDHKSLHPEVKWFEKNESLTLAVKIRNFTDHSCSFFTKRVVFRAFARDKYYLADLELNGEILPEKSSCMIKNEEPLVILVKANSDTWGNLLKQKHPNVSFDFEHWEDHEDSSLFPVVSSCAKGVYTDVDDGESSEESQSDSD